MHIHDVRDALRQANHTMVAADRATAELAELLIGRLRQVNRDNLYNQTQILRKLKAELSQFNSRTGKWR
ncbi:MAG: hypothetical protein ABGX63_00695 [bacterium]|jgi:sensor histidine kinase YesM